VGDSLEVKQGRGAHNSDGFMAARFDRGRCRWGSCQLVRVDGSRFGEELLDGVMLEEGSVESIRVQGWLARPGARRWTERVALVASGS
jgi:hypothetical protein